MTRTNFRAPRDHGAVLIHPAPRDLPAVAAANRRLLDSYHFELLGWPAQQLRQAARRAALAIPMSCTCQARFRFDGLDPDRLVIMTGHQPELYHPGVWLKNFLAGHLAEAVGGLAVNINVDNDEAHQTTVRAPVVDGDRVRRVEVSYVEPTGGRPYEELSADLLKDHVAEGLRAAGVAEVLCLAAEEYWQRLREVRERGTLPKVITCARHQLECRAGLDNLEVMVSELSRSAPYRFFVIEILANLERFHAAYNGGLRTFREVHHEPNPAQPMPDLGRDGGRWETPFWAWAKGGRRQRLWAEIVGGRAARGEDAGGGSAAPGGQALRLFVDGQREPFVTLEPRHLADGAAAGVTLLDDCERDLGIKIRPRALTLTLFARLFVADLFIHGLGGAIYDKVTDEIARHYYGVEPPTAVMATGTMLLPLQCYNVTPADRAALQRRLRDICCNPERLMSPEQCREAEVGPLIDRKAELIADERRLPAERRAAWHELRRVNGLLASHLAGEPEATRQALERTEHLLAENAVLRNREYTFAIYPRGELIDFYEQVTRIEPTGMAL